MMYFIPEFDDTDGYYQAASGVGIPSLVHSKHTEHCLLVVVLLGSRGGWTL